MKTAILSLVAVAASATPVVDFAQLNQKNLPDINEYSQLRGGRVLGKRKHKRDDALAIDESLVHALEVEKAIVQKLATKAEKRTKKEEKEKLAKEKKEKRVKEKKEKLKRQGGRHPATPNLDDAADTDEVRFEPTEKGKAPADQKKHLKRNIPKEEDTPPPVLMAKTLKPIGSEPNVSDPGETKRDEWLDTLSPTTMFPSFQPTISPTTEFGEKEGTEPPSLAPITSQPTTSAPTTYAPVAEDASTSIPTFVPSYSPTGRQGDVEATPTTSPPSSMVAVPATSSAMSTTSAPMSSPPTSTTSSVASAAVGDIVAATPTTPSPTVVTSSVASAAVGDIVAATPTTPSPTSVTSSVASVVVGDIVAATPTTTSPTSVVTAPPANSTALDAASGSLPDCPAAYDATKTTYRGGDEATVNEHIFECQKVYEKYCNIPQWDDTLLTGDASAKESWDDAWMHIGPCVAVTSDEV